MEKVFEALASTPRRKILAYLSQVDLTAGEIAARFDEIVEFAELQEFIDAPVKTYSSGMYMRLGFAVAIHVDPDILLVDEVLAVGDEAFTHKCLDKFAEFRRRGRGWRWPASCRQVRCADRQASTTAGRPWRR